MKERYFESSSFSPPLPRPHFWNLTDDNYRTAVATLVNKLGLTAINVHLGNMILTFGWTAFALTLLSAIGLGAVVVTEYTLENTQEKITRKAEEAVSRGTGGRTSSVLCEGV